MDTREKYIRRSLLGFPDEFGKVDNVIIDPAVFGLTNYYNDFVSRHSFLLKQNVVQFLPMTVPFIGTENAAILQNLVYREGEFDEDWDGADIKWQYGTFVATYLANAPQNCMMERLAEVLDEKYSQLFAEEVLNLVQLDRIGVKGGKKPEM